MIAIIILNCPIVEMSRPMPAHVKHLQCSVQPDGPSASVLGSDCLRFTLALSLTGDFCKLLSFSWLQTWGHREHNPREELWGWNEPCKVPETRNHSDGCCRYYYMLDLQMLFKWSTIPSVFLQGRQLRPERLVLITLRVPRAVQGELGSVLIWHCEHPAG